jgi:nucleoside-diphosphate-sugar epimerase
MSFDAIVITGSTGWLGYNLVEALVSPRTETGTEVLHHSALEIRCFVDARLGTDTAIHRLGATAITCVPGDITSLEDCQRLFSGLEEKSVLVVHTAGIIHPRRVRDFYDINERGTRNMIRAAQRVARHRMVHVSSNSPFGCNPRIDHEFTEESPYNPYMHYGKSKLLGEKAVLEAASKGDLAATVIRPPWFYGPNQPARQSLFFTMVQDGKFPVLGSGEQRRSMGYVDNLVQGIVKAGICDAAVGKAYWIADETPYSMNRIVTAVKEALKEHGFTVSDSVLRLPSIIADVAQVVDFSLQSVGIYHQKMHVLSEMNKTIACSVQKAKTELGYAPMVDVEEGMRRSVAWCLEHHQLSVR